MGIGISSRGGVDVEDDVLCVARWSELTFLHGSVRCSRDQQERLIP